MIWRDASPTAHFEHLIANFISVEIKSFIQAVSALSSLLRSRLTFTVKVFSSTKQSSAFHG